ncbi:hypothetical protein K431DRAFT_208309, partial [Polychaeton citri CBS 116435]
DGDGDEDGSGGSGNERTPLLPLFSAAHLDRLPLYNIIHAIRLLIVPRCETTLSWDQLRSPQVSQFLVKPIQSQIRSNHFNRATLCALISNSLQFQKEAQTNPGNVGVSKTRALISELLAMRLLKEFSTRELIDALSYDFDPLAGMSPPDPQGRRTHARSARVSTIEVAIRAQTKRFLAHPLVVQHLESIWAGTIVFHSAADNLHRKPHHVRAEYLDAHSQSALPADSVLSRKAQRVRTNRRLSTQFIEARRSVTLYNPRDASLFKLSRLRVPRYRQLFSTLSYATMLGLFVAVLADRSLHITWLEILFWIWSIGYMADEIVGFTEQGFGLYILSFWNAFDLGILVMFLVYYCLRLYGVILVEAGKHAIASKAYDVLATTAILLFPRLFSVLDHYRYFSQLLIAFRLMAQDLIAILILIFISCSGFFVAFTLSFSDDRTNASGVAYALFQMVMGFTPAAWDRMDSYNWLGKIILVIFLIICHFLIVTILITVLTNSFTAVVQNANEEHQFLFAINTISMVKSDALFSYIPPMNIFGWVLTPLRWLTPFRRYVKLNREVIKITHMPVLFSIYLYERLLLTRYAYEPADLVEMPKRSQSKPFAFSINKNLEVFSPGIRLREPSVISFRKDRALDEVFKRPFRGSIAHTTVRGMQAGRRNSSSVVDKWMQVADEEGGASPPMEQPQSILDRLEERRPRGRRAHTSERLRLMKQSREFSTATRSVASDPDRLSLTASRRPQRIEEESEYDVSRQSVTRDTDAEGDDEQNNESDVEGTMTGIVPASQPAKTRSKANVGPDKNEADDFYAASGTERSVPQWSATASTVQPQRPTTSRGERNMSVATMLYAPGSPRESTSPSISRPINVSALDRAREKKKPLVGYSVQRPDPGRSSPKHKHIVQSKARPVIGPRQKTAPTDQPGGLTFLDVARRSAREPSFNARALDLASEIGDNRFAPAGNFDAGGISGMPASFSEQLQRERDMERMREEQRRRSEEEEKGMVNRIMLARMNTLEEGFREVLREIKDLSQSRKGSEADSSA